MSKKHKSFNRNVANATLIITGTSFLAFSMLIGAFMGSPLLGVPLFIVVSALAWGFGNIAGAATNSMVNSYEKYNVVNSVGAKLIAGLFIASAIAFLFIAVRVSF